MNRVDIFHLAIIAVFPLVVYAAGYSFDCQAIAMLASVLSIEIHDTVKGQPLLKGARDFMFRFLGGLIGLGVALLLGAG